MDNLNNLHTIIARLDDSTLNALEASVREAREQKRARVDIDSIRAGMSADDIARTRAEIARVLAGQ